MIKKAFLLQKPDFQALSDTEMKQTDEVYNMEIIHSDKVITVIRRGLNRIDSRLIDHGVKVMLVLQDMPLGQLENTVNMGIVAVWMKPY